MTSVLCKFKSPTSLDKRQGFSGSGIQRFQGRVHYTPNLAQEINLSRIQRRINVDRVSIRKGAKRRKHIASGYAEANAGRQAPELQGLCNRQVGRRDKLAGNLDPRAAKRVRPPFTNADSYSRCFRYLDCFNGGVSVDQLESPTDSAHLYQTSVTFKAVYLSSQLDRKTDCFDGGTANLEQANVAHVEERDINGPASGTTFKAVCGTQTKQGGCLYEWPTYNQNQAMSTPDNLVGGVERLDHTNHFVGSMTAQ